MKYLKLFENINNININPSDYVKELNKIEFDFLLNNNCKNFNFNDTMLIRGDGKLNSNYYYLNGKNRIVDYVNNRMFPIHLEFMRSKKWDGLPKKDKSLDLVTYDNDQVRSGFFGTVYRVIPYDNAIFVSNNTLVGNYNKIINNDLDTHYLSTLSDSLKNYHNQYFDNTYDVKLFADNLNVLFSEGKEPIKKRGFDIIYKLFDILKEKNMTFREYMEYAFSPNNYQIMNYNKLIKSKNLYSWTDSPVLLKRLI